MARFYLSVPSWIVRCRLAHIFLTVCRPLELMELRVRTASQGVTSPPGGPLGRLFVPEALRSKVIRWGHYSKVACHPGVNHTKFLIKQQFWWPAMACDIRLFVLACSVCAVSKSSNRPPAGLLEPLLVPSRPWSHAFIQRCRRT